MQCESEICCKPSFRCESILACKPIFSCESSSLCNPVNVCESSVCDVNHVSIASHADPVIQVSNASQPILVNHWNFAKTFMKGNKMSSDQTRRTSQELRRAALRMIAESYYDHQKVRTGMMNRLRGLIRHLNEGIPLDQPEDKKEERTFDSKYADKKLPELIAAMFEQGILNKEERDYLVKALELAQKASSLEGSHRGPMNRLSRAEPIWTEYLSHVRGISTVLASNLISRIGYCEKHHNVSALWRHFGLHVICPDCTVKVYDEKRDFDKKVPVCAGTDGKCPECGKPGISPWRRKGVNLDFDPRLRTMGFKIGGCLIITSSPVYKAEYDRVKAEQFARRFEPGHLRKMYEAKHKKKPEKNPYKPDAVQLTPIHAHMRAQRFIIKLFLQNYWVAGRTLANLPITDPFIKDRLGHGDIITWQDVLKANGVEVEAKRPDAETLSEVAAVV